MSALTDQLSSLMADAFAGTMDADAFDARLAEVDAALEDAKRYRVLKRRARLLTLSETVPFVPPGCTTVLDCKVAMSGEFDAIADACMRAEAEDAADGR